MIDAWLQTTLALVLDNSVEFAVLAVLAGLLSFVLRRRDPRLRHALWFAALTTLVLPFDFGFGWGFGVPNNVEAFVTSAPFHEVVGVRQDGTELPAVFDRAPSSESSSGVVGDALASPVDFPSFPSVEQILARGWGIGFFGMLLVIAVQMFRARRLAEVAAPCTPLSRRSEALGRTLGWNGSVPVLTAESSAEGSLTSVGGPVLIGVLAPKILIPQKVVEQWTEGEVDAAIAHELAHVVRRDPWLHLFQRLLTAAFFFNPLMWLAARRLSVERELCCDDLVMRARGSLGPSYLRALLRSATASTSAGYALSVTGGSRGIGARIRRMADAAYSPRKAAPAALLAVLLLVAATAGALAGRQGEGASGSPDVGRVWGTTAYRSYYVQEADGVDWDEAFEVTGDVELGRQSGSLGLSELPIETSRGGKLNVRLWVEPSGAVREAQLEGSFETAFDEGLLQKVSSSAWNPSLHKDVGPVGIELLMRFVIEPLAEGPEPRPALSGVVEAFPFAPLTPREDGVTPTPVSTYLPILDAAPYSGVVLEELSADYNFSVAIEPDGRVGDVQAFGNSLPRGEWQAKAELVTELTSDLTTWIKGFSFEPPVDEQGVARRRGAMVDIRVDGEGVRVATYSPAASETSEAFDAIYRLEDGQVIKLIPSDEIRGMESDRLNLFRRVDPRKGRGRQSDLPRKFGPFSMRVVFGFGCSAQPV